MKNPQHLPPNDAQQPLSLHAVAMLTSTGVLTARWSRNGHSVLEG